MQKKQSILIFLSLLLLPLLPLTAQSEGIPLQKDVLLASPILGPEDLPEEITFTLYDSKTATDPLGSQTFTRGQYTVDFEFSKSDGISSGNIARVDANFTKILNLKDAEGESIQPKEIWAAIEVGGDEVGDRSKVSDETLVRLLLVSDASIATYLTLVYDGDDNPIATIYKDLPISTLSSDGSESLLKNYFTAVAAGVSGGMIDPNSSGVSPYWDSPSPPTIYYNGGNVGIGTTSPNKLLHLNNSSGGAYVRWTDATSGTTGSDGFLMGLSGSADFINYENSDMIFYTNGTAKLYLKNTGNVGIGTSNPGLYNLAVEGTIGCRELIVTTAAWADFVFEDNYRLPPLTEVERFISENKHLPGIPTKNEVEEKGLSVGNISSKLLQKIEELTLYIIDMKKENNAIKTQLNILQDQLNMPPKK